MSKKMMIYIIILIVVIIAIIVGGYLKKAIFGNLGYEIREDKVYYNGWNEGQGKYSYLIEGADSKTFTAIKNSEYGKDKIYVYHRETVLKDADPKSFEIISVYYCKDANHVYFQDTLMEGADSKSFSPLGGMYSKDNKNVYAQTDIIEGADLDSFVVLKIDYEDWAKDESSYFYQGSKIPVADYGSFTILGGGYAYSKDKINVYSEDNIVIGADTASFGLYKNTYLGKDKNGCYFFNEKRDCPK